MTAKEFVQDTFPQAVANKFKYKAATSYEIFDNGGYGRISEAKTEDKAWSLAKQKIIGKNKTTNLP